MDFLKRLFGPAVPVLNVHEVEARLKNGKRPVLVDVRESYEYRAGHIAGAKLIPLGELQRRMNEIPKDKEIICVCASGNRSQSAAKMLLNAGYTAINVRGGMLAWRQAGFPVKK